MRGDCNRVGCYFHALDIMPMMKQEPVLFLFNSPLSSGCDYVLQTARIVSSAHPAYGISLGDILFLPRLVLNKDRWVVRTIGGSVMVRPVSLLPGVRFRFVRMLTYATTALGVRIYLALRYRDTKKIFWFFEPFHIPPLLGILKGYTTLYDCVDYYPGFSPAAKHEHEICVRKADYVFANSVPLALQLRKSRRDTKVVPLGFAPELFSAFRVVPGGTNKQSFTVGYIGSISDRIDFPLLVHIVKKMPDVQFMFVGPVERNVFGNTDAADKQLQLLRRYANVTWMPSVSKGRIPSVLKRIDAGLIPYRSSLPFNRFSFPMKTFEYFAAGKPVLSTDIEALKPYQKNGLVYIISTAHQGITAIRALKRNGWNHSKQTMQRRAVLHHTWERKVREILTRVSASK